MNTAEDITHLHQMPAGVGGIIFVDTSIETIPEIANQFNFVHFNVINHTNHTNSNLWNKSVPVRNSYLKKLNEGQNELQILSPKSKDLGIPYHIPISF